MLGLWPHNWPCKAHMLSASRPRPMVLSPGSETCLKCGEHAACIGVSSGQVLVEAIAIHGLSYPTKLGRLAHSKARTSGEGAMPTPDQVPLTSYSAGFRLACIPPPKVDP